jgi:hypothetical protein
MIVNGTEDPVRSIRSRPILSADQSLANDRLSIFILFTCPGKIALTSMLSGLMLVYRLLNPLNFAASQLAVFQGASEAPLSESYGSSEQRGKTTHWPGPGGLR